MTMQFAVSMTNKAVSSILVVALSMSMSIAPNPAVAQSPSAATAKPSRVWIETDTQALGERGTGVQAAVTRELRATFEAEGVELVDQQQADAAHVRLRFGGTAEDVRIFNYTLHFELIEGKTATELIDPVTCEQCFAEKLHSTIAEQVPTLLEAVAAELAASSDSEGHDIRPPTGDGDGDGDGGGDGDGDSSEPLPKPIGALGYAGIGVAVLGLGASVGGAVVLSRGLVEDRPGDFYDRTVTDHRPPGYALIGVGATVTVAGLVMLGVDLGRRAKQRKRGSQQAVVVPLMSPTTAGVGVVGRF